MTYGEKIIETLIEKHGKFSIAFLPYKYAMWDSMETMYDAAVARGLTTYLMPIPYVTRGDGMWHDETPLFGNNTDDCSLLYELKPDIVVIHNPYDGNNKVTSIDPKFYSNELKAAGFKIVYIAYCGSVVGAQFALHQGVKNADYIFTASAEERQCYIDLWKTKGIDKSENVFDIGGLPKYEAVLKNRPMPECFERDPAEIVLICGSLLSFLNNPDARLQKWKDAIRKYADKENVRVIFRPHPLMADMISSMLKTHTLKYEAFLSEIEQYCLIDKSQNFTNAMRFADYLVTDPSSIIGVWKQTGKDYEIIE